MTDTTTPLPPSRRARRGSSRRQTRLDLRRQRRRSRKREPLSATLALARLAREGDVFDIGRRRFLVAVLDHELIEAMAVAAGSHEDDEDNGDDEPSVGTARDLESDGLHDVMYGGGEASLGWANEGPQWATLHCNAEETEPELGWANPSPTKSGNEVFLKGNQLKLADGYIAGDVPEGTRGEDDEDDDPGGDPLDKGEFDPCDLGEPVDEDGAIAPYRPTGRDAQYVAAARQRLGYDRPRRSAEVVTRPDGTRWIEGAPGQPPIRVLGDGDTFVPAQAAPGGRTAP